MGANALDHLREGRAEEALALYQAHDRLTVDPHRRRRATRSSCATGGRPAIWTTR